MTVMSTRTPNQNWRGVEQGERAREQLLDAIDTFIFEHGHSPTKAELAGMVGISDRTVTKHIRILVAEGKVIDEGPRTIRTVVL